VINDAEEKARQDGEDHQRAVTSAVKGEADDLMVELLAELVKQVMREQNAVLVHENKCHYDEVQYIHICPFVNRPQPHHHFVPGTMVHAADENPTRKKWQMRDRGVPGIKAQANREKRGQKIGDGVLSQYGDAQGYVRKTHYCDEEYYSRGHLAPPTEEEVEEMKGKEAEEERRRLEEVGQEGREEEREEERVEGYYDAGGDNQWVEGNGHYGEETGEWVWTGAMEGGGSEGGAAVVETAPIIAAAVPAAAATETANATAKQTAEHREGRRGTKLPDDPDLINPCLISASHDGIFKIWDVDSMDDIKAHQCVLQVGGTRVLHAMPTCPIATRAYSLNKLSRLRSIIHY
jgi:hypothetical protein